MDNEDSTTILKKAATMLVECGYSAPYKDMSYTENDGTEHIDYQLYTPCKDFPDEIVMAETCDPFSDNLESRQQLDALFWHLIKGRDMFYLDGLGHLDHREQMIEFVKAELSK